VLAKLSAARHPAGRHHSGGIAVLPTRLVLPALVMIAFAFSASADDKKAPFTGTWSKKDGELRLEFTGTDGLKIHPHGDKIQFAVVCEYTAKDGTVTAKITDLEGSAEHKEKAKQVVPIGSEFKFKFAVTKDSAKLEELTGDKADAIKAMLEGDFEAKK
jgi:hypothetical protein